MSGLVIPSLTGPQSFRGAQQNLQVYSWNQGLLGSLLLSKVGINHRKCFCAASRGAGVAKEYLKENKSKEVKLNIFKKAYICVES